MSTKLTPEEREKIEAAAREEAVARVRTAAPLYRTEAGKIFVQMLDYLVAETDVPVSRIGEYLAVAKGDCDRLVAAAKAKAQATVPVDPDVSAARYLREKERAGALGLESRPSSTADVWKNVMSRVDHDQDFTAIPSAAVISARPRG